MTDCNQTLRDIETFLDGELPDGEYQHVLGHINECMECFHAYDFQAELKQLIARKCYSDEMPPDLLARISVALASPPDAPHILHE